MHPADSVPVRDEEGTIRAHHELAKAANEFGEFEDRARARRYTTAASSENAAGELAVSFKRPLERRRQLGDKRRVLRDILAGGDDPRRAQVKVVEPDDPKLRREHAEVQLETAGYTETVAASRGFCADCEVQFTKDRGYHPGDEKLRVRRQRTNYGGTKTTWYSEAPFGAEKRGP